MEKLCTAYTLPRLSSWCIFLLTILWVSVKIWLFSTLGRLERRRLDGIGFSALRFCIDHHESVILSSGVGACDLRCLRHWVHALHCHWVQRQERRSSKAMHTPHAPGEQFRFALIDW
jgi:hypothetical protein